MAEPARIVRVTVTGQVQGVGYRVWASHEAQARGIAGWVRNRLDGSVEAVFAGPAVAVAALCEACRRGPKLADVRDVKIIDADESAVAEGGSGSGFRQLPTC